MRQLDDIDKTSLKLKTTIRIYDKTVEKRTTTKLPGVYIDETMSWENQISHNITEVQNGLRMLYTIRSLVLRTQEH